MPICSVHAANFRGLRDPQEIQIKPITLFIGPNSSGKSSCIHALATLAQTLKIPNSTRPISLDDEYAYVHLGRFIEVAHSKSYSDPISLGIDLPEVKYNTFSPEVSKVVQRSGGLSAKYTFRCTKRTRETSLDSAIIKIGDCEYTAKKSGSDYRINRVGTTHTRIYSLKSGFIFDELGSLASVNTKDFRSIYEFFALSNAQAAIQSELRKVLYLGPFRQSPLRRYPTRGANPSEVGAQGESAITLLANEIVQSRKRPHLKQIIEWLNVLGLAKKIDVTRVASSDLFDVTLTLADGKKFPIADLGYGLSQILPVLTQCSYAPKGATLLFEQPEIHLHSLAVRPLAKVFIDTVREKNAHVVAETHSPELFGEFISEMRRGNLNKDDFIAYRVSRKDGRSNLKRIEITFDGEDFDVYDNWESGLSLA